MSHVQDPCDIAVHDMAASSEGNLSEEGQVRLANHTEQCSQCRLLLATLVDQEKAPAPTMVDGSE